MAALTQQHKLPARRSGDLRTVERISEAVPAFFKRQGIKEGEWQYALHSDFRVIMRPGWPWRARVFACLLRQSRGFKRDMCVMQVGGDTKRDAPKLLPLFPGGINAILKKIAIEAYQEAGHNPTDNERERLVLSSPDMRRLLASLEAEDGVIVRMRAEQSIARLIEANLTLEEALTREQVTPLSMLTDAERKRVSNRILIYVLAKPKPATLKALNRHDDSFPQVGKNAYLSGADDPDDPAEAEQLLFDFVKGYEWPVSPEKMAAYSTHPEVRKKIAALQKRQADVEHQREELRHLLLKLAADENQGKLFDPTAALAPTSKSGEARGSTQVSADSNPPRPIDAKLRPEFSAPVAKAGESAEYSFPASTKQRGQARTGEPERDRRSQAPAINEASVYTVGLVFRRFAAGDDDVVMDLIARCKAEQPGCTDVHICEAIEQIGPKVRKANPDFPAKYLATSVLKLFQGTAGRQMAERAQESTRSRAPEPSTREQQIDDLASTIAWAEMFPNHIEAPATLQEIEEAKQRDPELHAEAARRATAKRKKEAAHV